MIRFIIMVIFLVIFLTLSLPVQFILWLIGFFNPSIKSKASLAIVNKAFHVVRFISGTKLDIIGLERVPADRPVVYVGNHRSYYDIILTYPYVKRETGYIAKDDMAHIPSFSRWMRYMHCLFLDRKDLKKGMQTIKDAIKLVEDGISVCIFPEGTRNKTADDLQEFHGGSFKIAERTGCTIIPVTINNTDAIFEQHAPSIRKAHAIIEYGEPIETKDLSREEKKQLPETVKAIILETYQKNKELV